MRTVMITRYIVFVADPVWYGTVESWSRVLGVVRQSTVARVGCQSHCDECLSPSRISSGYFTSLRASEVSTPIRQPLPV